MHCLASGVRSSCLGANEDFARLNPERPSTHTGGGLAGSQDSTFDARKQSVLHARSCQSTVRELPVRQPSKAADAAERHADLSEFFQCMPAGTASLWCLYRRKWDKALLAFGVARRRRRRRGLRAQTRDSCRRLAVADAAGPPEHVGLPTLLCISLLA